MIRHVVVLLFLAAPFASIGADKDLLPASTCIPAGTAPHDQSAQLAVGRDRLLFELAGEAGNSAGTDGSGRGNLLVRADFGPMSSGAASSGRSNPARNQWALKPRSAQSTLYSFPATKIWEGQQQVGPFRVTALASLSARGEPVLLAAAAVRPREVHFTWNLASSREPLSADMQLSTLESLYAFIYRQEPLYSYHPSQRRRGMSAGTSQASALAGIAELRKCIATELSRRGVSSVRRWEWVSITPSRGIGPDRKQVSARVRDAAGGAVMGASVAFARGEHLACEALTDHWGQATCKLFDSHGHEDHDDDEGDPRTVVTFGGLERPQVLLLPRTLVYRGR
jgi:hypothetical protein